MVKETYLTRILKMDAPKIMGKLKKKEVLTIYTTPHRTDTRTYTHTHTHNTLTNIIKKYLLLK